MKKKTLLVLLLVVSTFCFAEKWKKETTFDSWGEENGTVWVIYDAPITNVSSGGYDCIGVGVIYFKLNDGEEFFKFVAVFEYIAPYIDSGYVEVKDGPKVQADITKIQNAIAFSLIGLTLEEYQKSYEGKLVQLQWDNGEYITIEAPIWED